MLAIAPTDKEWFDLLRQGQADGHINFWTPTPWNLRRLSPGDRFYFLLKAPTRKVGGFGSFVEYVNLRTSEAWERFGQRNGVQSLDDLLDRVKKYSDSRSTKNGSNSEDPEIGCIVLSDPEFWDDAEFRDPAEMGVPVPDQVVKVKYFDEADPTDTTGLAKLKLVTAKDEIGQAQSRLESRVRDGAAKQGEVTLGFQGGKVSGTAFWQREKDIWAVFRSLEKKYWNAFGTGDPIENWQPIAIEINAPIEGVNRRLSGAYAKDQEGRVYLVHRGGVGGGRSGVGKKTFLDSYSGSKATISDGARSDNVVVVGELESPAFLSDLARFVQDVERYKAAVTHRPSSACWWVNQGKTYRAERDGEYLWAPLRTKGGRSVKHHQAVGLTTPRDVIIHYSKGQILSLGEVRSEARKEDRPLELQEGEWAHDGRIVEVNYFDLDRPIEISEIDLSRRQAEKGPFQKNGEVKQGYLYPLGEEFVKYVRENFQDRWPAGSPWHQARRTPRLPAKVHPEPKSMDWLVATTLWDRADLEEILDVLNSSMPQVVLAGPPGTGKTWVAKHIARFLVDDVKEHYRVVQFHPSYGYEEFIQGLRPVSDKGAISFQAVPGVVLEVAKEMGEDDRRVIVIDEMNRANLPRVFGELMYLFEYRDPDEPVRLQFEPSFHLPKKLAFIGTMNTADRSIRSIDIALRRRFDVFECPPSLKILDRYYGSSEHTNTVNGLLDGLEQLNSSLESHIDRHHTVGHTFFMTPHMTSSHLRSIWSRKLRPLIEEYFFDEPHVAADYTLDKFWPAASTSEN